jgi:hypothetical protein
MDGGARSAMTPERHSSIPTFDHNVRSIDE